MLILAAVSLVSLSKKNAFFFFFSAETKSRKIYQTNLFASFLK